MPTETRLATLGAGVGSATTAGVCLGKFLEANLVAGSEELADDESKMANVLPAPVSDFVLEPELCYLNTGTLGPMPRCVVHGVSAELQRIASNPLSTYFGSESEPLPATKRMDAVRQKLATFLGSEVEELCLMPSTTVALNTVATGLVDSGYLRTHHTVLQTDQEHPGGEACWRHLQAIRQLGSIDRVEIPPVPRNEEEIMALFEAAVRPTTRIICVSHVLTTSGTVLPLQRLATLAHANDALLVVDGAQAAGSLAVVLRDTGADIYTVSAHKWMLAPPGSALVYIRKEVQHRVQASYFDADTPPRQRSESATESDSVQYANDPARFLSYTHSSGTTPSHTIAGLGLAVSYLENLGGKAAVQAHNIALRNQLYHGLTKLSQDSTLRLRPSDSPSDGGGLRLLSPHPSAEYLCSSIVSFSIPEAFISAVRLDRLSTRVAHINLYPTSATCLPGIRLHVNDLQAELARYLEVEHKIIVKTCPHHSPEFPAGNSDWVNAVRLSLHVFNTKIDVDRLLNALRMALS